MCISLIMVILRENKLFPPLRGLGKPSCWQINLHCALLFFHFILILYLGSGGLSFLGSSWNHAYERPCEAWEEVPENWVILLGFWNRLEVLVDFLLLKP